ncbi:MULTISPECIES: sensor histidine kinase [Clostridium]|jgi:signal transduction histidine kinase|nr:HAMP domain-containing sensor histidine kinase [Clostridium sp. AF32-7AC]MCC2170566.1 HAMP domain-containing histidine kinase [Clostridium fessum]RHP43171.1 sensor histidine kinase [Clostridium sp. AF32-7AC]
MLNHLFQKLHLFFVMTIMVIVTGVIGLSFSNHVNASEAAEVTFLQRMTALIVNQLEEEGANAKEVLSAYEKDMSVSSKLTDAYGELLYESRTGLEDIEGQLNNVGMQIVTYSAEEEGNQAKLPAVEGMVEMKGNHYERYLINLAHFTSEDDTNNSLTLVYEQTPIFQMFLEQLPMYLAIWIVTLLCVSLVSRFLLKKALEPTERVMQSQKEFVASASHELKAPLAVIVANVENMQHEAQNEGLQGNLKVIDSECMRMSRLIKDMLLLASSDAEKWTIHTSEVNVDTLLISLYEAYEPRCMKKKIKLTLDLGEELFPVIMTDKERLFQLLSIYLDNALHYSPEGKEIQIRVDMCSKELTFWIVDHGIGVEEKAKPFIFDRFYCADQSHTDKSHFGLGLSIAKELARMLQGKIGMEDTPGGGASFFFTLDLK